MTRADARYRAVLARDHRFDGQFVVGSRTTGAYCRPSCRTRAPSRLHAAFFDTVGEAERAGFRACWRCRPAAGPAAGSRFVIDAVARIEAGALDDGSVDALAHELGVTARHLRRAMQAELGMSPVELAQSRRLSLALQLVERTTLPMTEIAFAAGFGSLRRFNGLFAAAHGAPPSRLRQQAGPDAVAESFALRLEHRGPLDWAAMIRYLAPRSLPGCERADRFAYSRLVQHGDHRGWVAVYPRVNQHALIAEISLSLVPVVVPIVARLRRLFDVDADIDAIRTQVRGRRRGVRVPGAFDGFEAAVLAIAGPRAARRLVRHFGAPMHHRFARLDQLPFDAAAIAGASERALASAGVRAAGVVRALARAVTEREISLEPTGDPGAQRARLAALGVPAGAVEVIAMRALRDSDAMPLDDLGLDSMSRRRTERWRPWRAYGAMQLCSGATS